jgi:hypothetical protein
MPRPMDTAVLLESVFNKYHFGLRPVVNGSMWYNCDL